MFTDINANLKALYISIFHDTAFIEVVPAYSRYPFYCLSVPAFHPALQWVFPTVHFSQD